MTDDAERMVDTTFVLSSIVGINALYRIRTAVNHIAQQKLGCTDCDTVRKNDYIQFVRKIVNGNKQIIPLIGYFGVCSKI
ncbi:Uncharacterised protein [Neisseria dentiae]|nr:Uncharacterised protein [Neisseria dentiae]